MNGVLIDGDLLSLCYVLGLHGKSGIIMVLDLWRVMSCTVQYVLDDVLNVVYGTRRSPQHFVLGMEGGRGPT